MVIKITDTGCSNWEFAAFYLIDPFVGETTRKFFRTQIINDKALKEVLWLLENVLKHKQHPQHAEETLQRTLQNMRDKGWITFLDNQGNYQLTNKGWELLSGIREKIRELRVVFKIKPET